MAVIFAAFAIVVFGLDFPTVSKISQAFSEACDNFIVVIV